SRWSRRRTFRRVLRPESGAISSATAAPTVPATRATATYLILYMADLLRSKDVTGPPGREGAQHFGGSGLDGGRPLPGRRAPAVLDALEVGEDGHRRPRIRQHVEDGADLRLAADVVGLAPVGAAPHHPAQPVAGHPAVAQLLGRDRRLHRLRLEQHALEDAG